MSEQSFVVVSLNNRKHNNQTHLVFFFILDRIWLILKIILIFPTTIMTQMPQTLSKNQIMMPSMMYVWIFSLCNLFEQN